MNAPAYRAKADYCRQQADRATRSEDKARWLDMAEQWLKLAANHDQSSKDQAARSERFDAMERDRGTHQEKSDAEH